MTKIKSAKDLIMLLLYAKGHKGVEGEAVVGRTRLMKMIFLFDKEIRKQFNLGFEEKTKRKLNNSRRS